MIDVQQTRPVDRFEFAQFLAGVVAVVHPPQIRTWPGCERHTGTVCQHVTDGGALLAVSGVVGQVVADPVVKSERPSFDEHVDHRRADRLGRRVHTERGSGGDRNLLGANRIGGSVAPAVPDRAVEHHSPVVTQTQLDRGLHPGPVPMPRCVPDLFDRDRVECAGFLVADVGDGLEVGRHADAAWLHRTQSGPTSSTQLPSGSATNIQPIPGTGANSASGCANVYPAASTCRATSVAFATTRVK